MKAPKINLDSAKLQQLLLLHVEKIVLGVVLLVVLWFVYQGASLTGLEATETPDTLTAQASNVTNNINDPANWDRIRSKREFTHDVQSLVRQGQEPNDSTGYRMPSPWKTPDYPKASLRVDPRYFSPVNIKVVPLSGPLAYLPKMGEIDPILATEVSASGDGMQAQPQVRPQPPIRIPTGEGPSPKSKRPKSKGGVLEEGLNEGFSQPGGFGEGLGSGSGGVRVLPPEAKVGIRASGQVVAREGRAVVVMAAVPLEKQLEEYEKAFKEALDYDPLRDVPRYVLFLVERADVTDDPAQDPGTATWTQLSIVSALNEMNRWAPSPPEVVDLAAIDPLILTHRVPPFLQRDIYEALVHQDIPKAKLATNDQAGGEGSRPGENPAQPELKEGDLLRPDTVAPAPGAGAGLQGEGLGQGAMMRQNPYARQPGGYGEGLSGGGSPEMQLAKYKLIRFTDTTVQPLRKYRYRVKLILEDPNNPYVGEVAPRWDPGRTVPLRKPSIQSMMPNVLDRVRQVEKTTPNRAIYRESEPSEPSEVVELPEIDRYFAGHAVPGGGSALKPGTPVILTSQPSAQLLTVEWDTAKACDVPGEKEVFRGSTLNFEKDAEVIHPALWTIAPIGKYSFNNGSMVLDFTGGNEIPSLENRRSDTKVQEPCEILIFDGLGKLQVLNETDDIEGYRRYLPPKPEQPRTASDTQITPEGAFPGGNLLDGPARPPRGRQNRGP